MIDRRLSFHGRYREAFGGVDGVSFMPVPEWSGWNGWLTCVTFDDAAVRDPGTGHAR